MKWRIMLGVVWLALVAQPAGAASFYDLTAETIGGEPLPLKQYRGKVLLIANIASQCGFTPQLRPLQKLHEKYRERGLVVLGVPSNQFGGQTPQSNDGMAKFCSNEFGVTFPLTAKTDVNGKGQSEIFRYLKANAPEKGEVAWNFEKFLVSRKGEVVARYRSKVEPDAKAVVARIESLLKQTP